jgi:hypothetical protein
MRTAIGLSRRQVGATWRAGTFLDVSRAFVSSELPERAPGGAGMIWARQMDENPNPGENENPRVRLDHFSPSRWKKDCRRPHCGDIWRCSNASSSPRLRISPLLFVLLIQVKRSLVLILPSRTPSAQPPPTGPQPWWRGGRGGSRWCSRPRMYFPSPRASPMPASS